MDRTEYLEALKAGWELADKHSYELKNVKIQLLGGKATYTGTEVEKLRLGENRITVKSNISGTIESIHGRLQFTKIIGDAAVQTVT